MSFRSTASDATRLLLDQVPETHHSSAARNAERSRKASYPEKTYAGGKEKAVKDVEGDGKFGEVEGYAGIDSG